MLEFVLHIADEEKGRFLSLEGVSGELGSLSGEEGPFLSLLGAAESVDEEGPSGFETLEGTAGDAVISVEGPGRFAVLELGTAEISAVFFDGVPPEDLEVVIRAPGFRVLPQGTLQAWTSWAQLEDAPLARWMSLSRLERRSLLTVSRMASTHRSLAERCADVVDLDGRTMVDYPSAFLSLGEAFLGIGGYVGSDLDGLADVLLSLYRGREFLVRWSGAADARRCLSASEWRREDWRREPADGPSKSLFQGILGTLRDVGADVRI